MKFPERINEHARGEKFDNLLVIPITQTGAINGREDAITAMTAGKRILHVGCLDHIPLIDEKIKSGIWFHKILTDSAETCLGIDINQEGIDYVRNSYDVTNIINANLMTGEGCEQFNTQDWDIAIFGEVLEHIDNPVFFLSQFRKFSQGRVKSIIVTVPNAFRRANVLGTFRSRERVNSDHFYWFTPYTLLRVLFQSGWHTRTLEHCQFGKPQGIIGRMKWAVISRWPMLADDLVATADLEAIDSKKPAAEDRGR
ncbi:class I SAM-dependent methyltransferase [Rubripirellula tenax]|nr:class I SAM-dependent methyltransferase [Rubripirellula tenax]